MPGSSILSISYIKKDGEPFIITVETTSQLEKLLTTVRQSLRTRD